MPPVVLKLSKSEINEMKKYYQKEKIDTNIPYTDFPYG